MEVGEDGHQGAVHCEVNEVAHDKQEFTFLGEENYTGLLRPLRGTELVSTRKSSFSQSGRTYRESSPFPHSPVPRSTPTALWPRRTPSLVLDGFGSGSRPLFKEPLPQ